MVTLAPWSVGYSHFTDTDSEPQRAEVTCPGHTAREQQRPGSIPQLLNIQVRLLPAVLLHMGAADLPISYLGTVS